MIKSMEHMDIVYDIHRIPSAASVALHYGALFTHPENFRMIPVVVTVGVDSKGKAKSIELLHDKVKDIK
tara:strand:- start:266 stop:472 length:207 start_codon:yes stop_codon:yes gene_type:complete